MVDYFKRVAVAPGVLFAIILALGVTTSSRADDAISREMQRCATIDDSTARLACFDELAGRDTPAPAAEATAPEPSAEPVLVAEPATQPSAEPVPVAEPAPEPVAAKTLDDIDSETQPRSAGNKDEELQIRARVTRCEKSARKRYYFVFDNGQVWKQTSDKRLSYRECDFEVTITKDFFGYKMQRDGEKGRTRISRVR